jgi:type VI protein secretion system component VasK
MADPNTISDWHLSKTVPIGLIIGLMTQGAAIVWTVSMMMSDIESNREDLIELQARVQATERSSQQQAISMARIDENIKAIRDTIERMARERNP